MKLRSAFLALLFVASSDAQDPTWQPGNFSDGTVVEDKKRGTKIFLSNGLMGRAIAWTGEPVLSTDGNETVLGDSYHVKCDGGATFDKADGSGGYYYVSNSETGNYPDDLTGGVYSLEFTADHELIGYTRVLSDTVKNCHGGETPWGTWISCEETPEFGRCWQVDPTGTLEAKPTNLTGIYKMPGFGKWEAFAWDEDSDPPRGYITNDDYYHEDDTSLPEFRGAVVRFTPDDEATSCLEADTPEGKWCAMETGTHDFLKLIPDSDEATSGSFEWVSDVAEANPALYAASEGAHVEDGILTFSTVWDRYLFRLNLEDNTYVRSAVPFPFEPDNLRILDGTVYICTDGDDQPGDAVWGWDETGAFRIFYEEDHSYPAGVDFTVDKMMMYVSMYNHATWQFWREDGLAFDEPTAGILYEVDGGIDDGKTHEELGIPEAITSKNPEGTAAPAPSNSTSESDSDMEETDAPTTSPDESGNNVGTVTEGTNGDSSGNDSDKEEETETSSVNKNGESSGSGSGGSSSPETATVTSNAGAATNGAKAAATLAGLLAALI